MITTLETVPFDTINTSKQKSRQRARHGIEAYVKHTDLDDPRVQALADFSDLCSAQFLNRGIKWRYSVDLIEETIRTRKNRVRAYIQACDKVNE